jgi:peptidoglycan hydrolase-like protein with peptidoglycan-binding domain
MGGAAVRMGETGPAVAALQMALIDLGYAMPNSTRQGNALADGIFGNETHYVVKMFQSKGGLVVDGVVGPRTLGSLDAALHVFSAVEHRKFVVEGHRDAQRGGG